MPRLREDRTRADALAASVCYVLAHEGATSLSLRRIARLSGVSPPAVLHHLGTKDELLRVSLALTAGQRLSLIGSRTARSGALAFLPEDEDERDDLRAWLAWQEMARTSTLLGAAWAEGQRQERLLLSRSLDHTPSEGDLDDLHVVIAGLQIALCRPERPLELGQARVLLSGHVDRLDPPTPDGHQ